MAILDSGIDSSHPDLAGRVVDSVDFTGSGTGDRFGHGTAVAGIVAAGLDNGIGIAGLSTAPLLDGKILNDEPYSRGSDALACLACSHPVADIRRPASAYPVQTDATEERGRLNAGDGEFVPRARAPRLNRLGDVSSRDCLRSAFSPGPHPWTDFAD